MDDSKELMAYGAFVVFILCCALGVWVLKSSCEASSYNRVTGSNVSTWDAMFLELRVQEGAKP